MACVECDEQWAFVQCKRKTAERLQKNTEVCGDRYCFTAIDRDSKLLLCFHTGQRSADDTWKFADKLYLAVAGRPTINTDGFKPYESALPLTFGHHLKLRPNHQELSVIDRTGSRSTLQPGVHNIGGKESHLRTR